MFQLVLHLQPRIIQYQRLDLQILGMWVRTLRILQALQIQPNIIDETFVVILTPTIGADYGAEETRKLVLHALAEQWLWSLSEKPTMLYDLHQTPRALLSRLLRWHSGSPFPAINRIEQLIEKEQTAKTQ
ncbi:MAG: hypothetical protein IPO36_11520 [Anaerolineales bacterium]|nr:hypothetical protein [Anaerolineales bacterium]